MFLFLLEHGGDEEDIATFSPSIATNDGSRVVEVMREEEDCIVCVSCLLLAECDGQEQLVGRSIDD